MSGRSPPSQGGSRGFKSHTVHYPGKAPTPARRGREIADIERWAVWTVALHTIVVSIHAVAHVSLQILPAAPDAVFILLTYFVAPVASALLFRARPKIARPLFFLAMVAGFIYGFAYHYILPGPDNVASIPRDAWGLVFVGTTTVLALLEALGVYLGSLLLNPPRRAPTPAVGS